MPNLNTADRVSEFDKTEEIRKGNWELFINLVELEETINNVTLSMESSIVIVVDLFCYFTSAK